MTIVQKAKQWLDEPKPDNGAPEPDEFDDVREIISGLLLEVKCLKIQVCDRGNSYQKAEEERKRLRAAMEDCVAGHDDCCNYVCNKIKEALAE